MSEFAGFLEKFLNSGWCFRLSDGRFALGAASAPRSLGAEDRRIEWHPYFSGGASAISVRGWETVCWSGDDLRRELRRLESRGSTHFSETAVHWSEPDLGDYESRFVQVKNGIASGRLKKMVLFGSSLAHASPTAEDRRRALLRCTHLPPEQRVFGIWGIGTDGSRGEAGVLGVTPEVLFRREHDGSGFTMALAGTKRVARSITELRTLDGTPEPEPSAEILLGDPKERLEHEYVINDILQRLEPLATQISEGPTTTRRAGSLLHLYSPIRFTLRPSITDRLLTETLHPTAALGVLPRSFARDEWRTLCGLTEGSRYGAPFLFSDGRMTECLVSIRCIRWDADGSELTTGSGIVAGSELHREWAELATKRLAVREILGW